MASPVSVKDLGKRVRVNVTLTEQQLREIDRHARARGMTRSAFLVKAGLQVVDVGLNLPDLGGREPEVVTGFPTASCRGARR